jgi:hypothetical protein
MRIQRCTHLRTHTPPLLVCAGLQHLLCGGYALAAACFHAAAPAMRRAPQLWLRLAECAIGAADAAAADAAADAFGDAPRAPVAAVVGSGPFRRLVLARATPRREAPSQPTQQQQAAPPEDAPPAADLSACGDEERPLTLEYAALCLRNAEALLDADAAAAVAAAAVGPEAVAAAAAVWPAPLSPSDAAAVRAALLAARAYVCLLRGALRGALAAADALLSLPGVRPEASLLARCYAAEALCGLDRPEGAVEHLTAALLERDADADGGDAAEAAAALAAVAAADADADADADDADAAAGSAGASSAADAAGTACAAALRGGRARATLHVNLSAVYASQGEHTAAAGCAASALAAHAECAHARLAAVFVELSRGRTDAARAMLRQQHVPPYAAPQQQQAQPPMQAKQAALLQQQAAAHAAQAAAAAAAAAAAHPSAGWAQVPAHPRRGGGGGGS